MRKTYKVIGAVLAVVAAMGLLVWYLKRHTVAVLSPAGQISAQEKHLMAIGIGLSVIVVVPVYIMTASIAWRYRENNKKPRAYTPDWDGSRLYESIWWGIPIVIIAFLSVITWQSAHQLDPFRPLSSTKAPVTVQVVSLDWKWLFIYPKQQVASVNELVVPVDTPINLDLTSDSVMNSFWVPQLGGQIYTMPGMITQLHLNATRPGSFFGSPANIAGRGYARMDFRVRATSASDFTAWLGTARTSQKELNLKTYNTLAAPSDDYPVTTYAHPISGLFQDIVTKYMVPSSGVLL